MIRELPLPTRSSAPTGILFDPRPSGGADRILVAESAADRFGLAEADYPVIAGAGKVGPIGSSGFTGPTLWDTEFQAANPEGFDLTLEVSLDGGFFPCTGSCPRSFFLLEPYGSGRFQVSEVFSPPVIGTWYASPRGFDLPTLKARILNRDVPTLSADLPVVRHSTILTLDPKVLSFPGAERNPAGARSNLILENLERRPLVAPNSMTVLVEVFSSSGNLRGHGVFTIGNFTLSLIDVLGQLGISELDGGQVRVRKVEGNGLLWGVLATIREDATLTLSLGVNP